MPNDRCGKVESKKSKSSFQPELQVAYTFDNCPIEQMSRIQEKGGIVGERIDVRSVFNNGMPLTERQEDCSDDKRGQKTINLCLTCRRGRGAMRFALLTSLTAQPVCFCMSGRLQGVFILKSRAKSNTCEYDSYKNLISVFSEENGSFAVCLIWLLEWCGWLLSSCFSTLYEL